MGKLREDRAEKKYKIIQLLVFLLVLVVIAAASIGAVYVPFMDTVKIILKNMGILKTDIINSGQESIIFYVRLPRVIVAMLVGAALSTSGCVMQSMFKNPMADPGIIGVSSGASLGAVAAIALQLTSKNLYIMPVFAIAGALMAAWLIFMISSRGGKIPVLTLILSGIAVSTFIGAVTNFILTRVNEYQVREYLFWSVGSLDGRRWEHVNMVALPILICIGILITFSKELNILLLGEEEAQSLGLNPSSTRKRLLFFVSITTAMAVCVSGNISFVGLIVPHIMRLIAGPDNKILLPASAIAGAIFLVACDLVARVVIMPSEINVGIVTSLLGAPYFIYLLNKARKEGSAL
jgi:iron complex transport system permease protein